MFTTHNNAFFKTQCVFCVCQKCLVVTIMIYFTFQDMVDSAWVPLGSVYNISSDLKDEQLKSAALPFLPLLLPLLFALSIILVQQPKEAACRAPFWLQINYGRRSAAAPAVPQKFARPGGTCWALSPPPPAAHNEPLPQTQLAQRSPRGAPKK